jgi:hypothetical protein
LHVFQAFLAWFSHGTCSTDVDVDVDVAFADATTSAARYTSPYVANVITELAPI